jgi:hypothetical protein
MQKDGALWDLELKVSTSNPSTLTFQDLNYYTCKVELVKYLFFPGLM